MFEKILDFLNRPFLTIHFMGSYFDVHLFGGHIYSAFCSSIVWNRNFSEVLLLLICRRGG